jgi:hypothetical protein
MFHKMGHFRDLDDFPAMMPHAVSARGHHVFHSVKKRLPCVMTDQSRLHRDHEEVRVIGPKRAFASGMSGNT